MNIIETLEKELEQLKAAERLRLEQERKARQDMCKPEYKYIIEPIEHKDDWRYKNYPENKFYRIYRQCLNKQAAIDAGNEVSDGGMDYVISTDGFIDAVGGGTCYIKFYIPAVRKELFQFLKNNPDGGDITTIYNLSKITQEVI